MSVIDSLIGRPLPSDEEEENKVGVAAGVPLLGLDALASSAYGPEAALTVLIPLGAAGRGYVAPVIGLILGLLLILFLSYRQTIAAYPAGGGSYTVAKENLGERAGLFAAAALLLDYILVVAVGISAGVGALISAFPNLHEFRILLCLVILILIAVVNLRGVRESGVVFMLPTYLFAGSLSLVLVVGAVKAVLSGGQPVPVDPPPAVPAPTEIVTGGGLIWLLMRAFASGCTAMTGVEVVSNGVSAFEKPAVKNAQRTLAVIVALLGALLLGLTLIVRLYGVSATPPEGEGYESVLSQLVGAIVGRGWFYYVVLLSTLAILAFSANSGFAGFPRLCRLLASDDYLPHAFANRGRRLVYTLGIVILAVLSGLLLIGFHGVTDRLIPLFAVGAFGAFTLSQAGMVVHWRKTGGRGRGLSLLINGVGAVATALALAVVLAAKFAEGAWVTLGLLPGLYWLFVRVKRHYNHVNSSTQTEDPITMDAVQAPVVVIPVRRWNVITRNAVIFALPLSPHVVGVHVIQDSDSRHDPARDSPEAEEQALRMQWHRLVVQPAVAAGYSAPELRVVPSRYRRLFTPLMRQVLDVGRDYPGRKVAVIIPELVESRWYQYLLHNQRATALKAALLLRGGSNIVVINVPWYLEEPKN